MQYKYIATNREGKKLTGIINAADQNTARAQLNNLGFSILEIKESNTPPPAESNLEKFEFEAIDRNGKKIKGTIPAKTPNLAYKRLVEEYSFNVLLLVNTTASTEERERMKTIGIQELQNQYEIETHGAKHKEGVEAMIESPEFMEKKKEVINEVDMIIGKIKTILVQFEEKISPDKKAMIHGYMDKLLRIKSSNNLEYISHTCQDLLKKIQEEEIFLQNKEHKQERTELLLESQKMMMELNKVVASKKEGISTKSKLIALEEKLKGSPLEFLLDPLRSMRQWWEPAPEMALIQTQLSALHAQEWDALKLYFKSPKETKQPAWEDFKKLRAREKEIRNKKKTLQSLRQEKNKFIRREKHVYLIEEVNTFTGWLLAFYLTYYFWGHYVTTQQLAFEPLLGIPLDLSRSALFKYLIVIIFLIHGATSLKLNFFLKSRLANGVLATTVMVLSLLTVFNF